MTSRAASELAVGAPQPAELHRDVSLTEAVRRFDERESPRVRAVAVLFLMVMAVRTWIPDLLSGPRLDENLTAWIVSGDLGDAIGRSWRHQGQSPLYFAVLWLWGQVFGTSMVVLRVPSLVAGIAASWNLRSLGKTFDRRLTGDLAGVMVFGFSTGLTDARPYSFLILALVVAARCGVAWAATARRRSGLCWVFAAAVAIYMHPFAVYALAAQLMWVVRGLRSGNQSRHVLGLAALGLVLVAPIIPQLLSLQNRSGGLVLVELPDLASLLAALLPLQVGVAGVAVLLWCRDLRTEVTTWRPIVHFVVAWAALPAIGLFVQSHVTGDSVFLEHYYSGAFPGAALVCAMLLARAWRTFSPAIGLAVFGVAAIVLIGPTPSHDWPAAVAVATELQVDTDVWTMAAYIEANDASVFADGPSSDYLNAPFRIAGASGPLYGLPLQLDDEANAEYVAGLVDRALQARRHVVIVQRNDKRYPGADQAAQALIDAGYVEVDRQVPAGLTVTVLAPNA